MKKSLKNLPNNWINRFENYFPDNNNILNKVEKAFLIEKRKPVFRINTLKTDINKVLEEFKNNNIKITKIDYLINSYLVENAFENEIRKLDCYNNGEIYLQNISSQIPTIILNPKSGEKVLDTCSAPGSKTTQMATLMENNGEITALELNKIRLEKLKYNIKKQGINIVNSLQQDATKLSGVFEENSFDKILIDAPCTAEGRINLNNEKSYHFLSRKNTLTKAKLQKEILKSVIPLLKSGGELVYSTCTLAPEENEAIINFILSQYKDLEIVKIDFDIPYKIPALKKWGKQIFDSRVSSSLKILPSESTEGFFIAKLKKK
ncbi:MAG: RsmB/NOP family class I SAM-dependent RNA methyltransferase [Candidatus Gracilibacteria bacterium]|nr:RsmB/NOP family class I SAM-dependent RNA methyltransferase [Candidatus Gracilibacteria bacterium]